VFDKETFWEEVKRVKNEYDVRISSKHSARSAKRITILVSNAFLSCIGGTSGTDYLFHWTQCLEAELFRACKEKCLDCDSLELEAMERNYFCRKTQKKVFATAFDNHRICTNATDASPKARLFADIITDLLALEEVKEDVRSEFQKHHFRRGTKEAAESEQVSTLKHEEKGASFHRAFEDSEDIPRRQCFEVVE